jgi:ubiquinone/menaquinone biosynthesis C-methylase UbiE
VGGGDGNFSIRLARKYPEMRCIIQDIAAQASYFKPPPDVADRLQYQVHDIFSPQPVQKADAYVFRIVLHVFADDMKAAAILKNVLPVLKENSRILLVDMKLDPQGPVAWSRYQAYAPMSYFVIPLSAAMKSRQYSPP